MKRIIFILAAAVAVSCAGNAVKDEGGKISSPPEKKPVFHGDLNFKVIISTEGIDNPANDRRGFYKVFINKTEEGRTTIGLESQEKYYEHRLPANRHLVSIERWLLDEKTETYVKLNNVNQPKPSFFYVTVKEDSRLTLRVKIRQDNTAEFSAE